MAVKDIDKLTISDIKPITVSFKKNKDELVLYKWILKHSCYSSFIKDILRATMENERNENIKSKTLERTTNQNDDSLIELNF